MKFKVMLDRKTNKKYISVGGQRIYTVKDVTCKEFLSDVKAALRKQVKQPKPPKPPKPFGLGNITTNVNLNIPEDKRLVSIIPIVEQKEDKKEVKAEAKNGNQISAQSPLEPFSPLIQLQPLDVDGSDIAKDIKDRLKAMTRRTKETLARVKGEKLSEESSEEPLKKPRERKYPPLPKSAKSKKEEEEVFKAPKSQAAYELEEISERHKEKLEEEALKDMLERRTALREAFDEIRGVMLNRYTKKMLGDLLPANEKKYSRINSSKQNMILDLIDRGNTEILANFKDLKLDKDKIFTLWSERDPGLELDTLFEGSGDVMSTLDIDEILKRYKPEYLGAFPRNEWPELRQGRNAIVMNFDEKGGSGTHWVGIIILSSGTVMYFDSFGRPMPIDMAASLKPQLEKLNPKTHFKLKENNVQVQNASEKTCGWHVTKWIIDMIGRNKSFRESTGFDDSIKGEQDVDKLQKKFDKYL